MQSFFHGTKAELKSGDLITPGFQSNFPGTKSLKHVYMTSNLNVAAWGAELSAGDKPCRIYVVESTGAIEDDPNVTNKKFPGNPTNSFRTLAPLRIVGEVSNWQGHTVEEIKARKESVERLMQSGGQIID